MFGTSPPSAPGGIRCTHAPRPRPPPPSSSPRSPPYPPWPHPPGPHRPPGVSSPARAHRPSAARPSGPGAEAPRSAVTSLPDEDPTATLVRIGGTGGTRRGSAGVHDLRSGRPERPLPGRFGDEGGDGGGRTAARRAGRSRPGRTDPAVSSGPAHRGLPARHRTATAQPHQRHPGRMFTVPAGIEGATHSAGLQRFEYGGRVAWIRSGARYGYSTVLGATRDLNRTLVHSVNSTDAKGESMNPVAERIAPAALRWRTVRPAGGGPPRATPPWPRPRGPGRGPGPGDAWGAGRRRGAGGRGPRG